jgi:hypothetical protein
MKEQNKLEFKIDDRNQERIRSRAWHRLLWQLPAGLLMVALIFFFCFFFFRLGH